MNKVYIASAELENKLIVRKYRELLSFMYPKTNDEQRKLIRKAFTFSVSAHKDMRRRSGEPFVFHPIAVAKIVSQEINLGTTSVVCALLHDVVENTDYTISDIRDIFGEKIARIIDGLTKIDDLVIDSNISIQAENFRKIFLSMTEDIRVILIKLADRLHDMRTLDSMPLEKQWKIASETSYFYVPVAHRLGLYAIKSELEDFAMLYTDPTTYHFIESKLKKTESDRQTLISDFVRPIQERLDAEGIKAVMSSRTKSIFSISQKMKRKGIPFEEVYDIFAVRYVFDCDPKDEVRLCWAIYAIVTSLYESNPDRLRNFLAHPKPNGYQSLHVTAMSKTGRWVEVQIRSKRMDEIAEKGFAAHYRYKEDNIQHNEYESRVEDWLRQIREVLNSKETNALDFLNEIKLNLDLKEIYLFTPKGDMKQLPAGSTVLDFAYDLHSSLGDHCIGAKVNSNIVPASHVLNSGDQIEIITSKKQFPKAEWYDFVKTSRARERIKDAIRAEQKKSTNKGMFILKRYFTHIGLDFTPQNIGKVQAETGIRSPIEFWDFVSQEKLNEERIRKIFSNERNSELEEIQKKLSTAAANNNLDQVFEEELSANPEVFMLGDTSESIRYKMAPCCNPIPGDKVVGFQLSNNEIIIHQVNCPHAIEQMSKFGNRIIKTKWRKEQNISFLTGIRVQGFDKKGMLKEILDIITSQLNLNIRSLHIETKDSVFSGTLMFYIENLQALHELMEKLKGIDNLEKIERIGCDFD